MLHTVSDACNVSIIACHLVTVCDEICSENDKKLFVTMFGG